MSSSPISSSNSDAPPAPGASVAAPAGARWRLDELVGPLADVTCGVSVQLGTGRVSVRRLLSLDRHAVLRLSQPAGEDLQVVVHGVPIAAGEVVIVDDNTAVRVTQIAAPPTADREGE